MLVLIRTPAANTQMTLASALKKDLQLIQQLGLKRLMERLRLQLLDYYADKAVAGGKTVTRIHQMQRTVTFGLNLSL